MMAENITHDDLVVLTEWMARHGFTADEVVDAVAKPWKHLDYLERACQGLDPDDLSGVDAAAWST